jgi:hypothetical protein
MSLLKVYIFGFRPHEGPERPDQPADAQKYNEGVMKGH